MKEIKVSVVDYGRKFLQLRYVDPLTGKQKTKSSETNDRKQAIKAAGKWEDELRAGRYKPASTMTWTEFRDRYETDGMATHADQSIKKTLTAFSLVEKLHLPKPKLLRDVTTESIARWMTALLADRAPATAALYARHLRAGLRWAKEQGFIHEAPRFRMPKGSHAAKMKGRPLCLEEHERMLAAVPKIVGPQNAPEWTRFLNGLWWSGLRLGEALRLSWEPTAGITIVLHADGRADLRFKSGSQKSRKAQIWACPPEFAELLHAVPEAERTGFVFNLPGRRGYVGRIGDDCAGSTIAEIGEKAQILVDEALGKHATAHDYRRSFGSRWAKDVMPLMLQKMMRHSNLKTTMGYYVSVEADEVAAAMYAARKRAGGNTFGNTEAKNVQNAGKN